MSLSIVTTKTSGTTHIAFHQEVEVTSVAQQVRTLCGRIVTGRPGFQVSGKFGVKGDCATCTKQGLAREILPAEKPEPTPAVTSPFERIAERQLRRYVVGRQITCPRSGEVLDVRTAVFLIGQDGLPSHALSQSGFRSCLLDGTIKQLIERGLTVDFTTIKNPALRRTEPEPPPAFEVIAEGQLSIEDLQ